MTETTLDQDLNAIRAHAYHHQNGGILLLDHVWEIHSILDRVCSRVELIHWHTDPARRIIREYNWVDFSVQQFDVVGDCTLWDHYHNKSDDIFWVSEVFVFDDVPRGDVVVLTQLIQKWENWVIIPSDNIRESRIKKDDIFVIMKNVAHTFFVEKGTKFRWFRPYPFDKNDMDMNPYKLELPK